MEYHGITREIKNIEAIFKKNNKIIANIAIVGYFVYRLQNNKTIIVKIPVNKTLKIGLTGGKTQGIASFTFSY